MNTRIPKVPPIIVPLASNIIRPLWSVMIPTHNCINYIEEALESVLKQDPGVEFMQIEVVDDFSIDGDVEAMVRKIGQGRISFFKQPYNRGSLRNFETCINRSQGYYVHILHGDDCVANGFYKEIEMLFNDFPEVGAAFTNFSYINKKSQDENVNSDLILEKPGVISDFLFRIAQKQLVQPPAIVVKRSVYENVGSFYAVHFGEDWEMWTRIASKYPVAYSPKRLALYRVAHGIGISNSYFLTGQNILDIQKVISIIQWYVPISKRAEYKKSALDYCAIYCMRVANGLLATNERAAFIQMKGALQISRNTTTTYLAIRFIIMYVSRYKKIERIFASRKTK